MTTTPRDQKYPSALHLQEQVGLASYPFLKRHVPYQVKPPNAHIDQTAELTVGRAAHLHHLHLFIDLPHAQQPPQPDWWRVDS